jgi:hypothetical protein
MDYRPDQHGAFAARGAHAATHAYGPECGARRTFGSYRAMAVTPASGHAAYPRRSR